MKSFLRLFRDCFSKKAFTGKTDKDEMMIYERNRIYFIGMQILTYILIFGFSNTYDLFVKNIDDAMNYIELIIGIVYYVMLLIFCKRGVVMQSSALITFFWSMTIIPFKIFDMLLINKEGSLLIAPIGFVVIFTILYIIADIVYLRALKKSECN